MEPRPLPSGLATSLVFLASGAVLVLEIVALRPVGPYVVPWHLATREMAADVARVLRSDGIYVQNVIDYPPDRFIRAELATVAAVFPHVGLIAPRDALAGKIGSNFVIVASKSPLPFTALRARLAPTLLVEGPELAEFVGNARVLTDDYAPVDQLVSG